MRSELRDLHIKYIDVLSSRNLQELEKDFIRAYELGYRDGEIMEHDHPRSQGDMGR